MSPRSEILEFLSDGRIHSETEVANTLGLSRSAVCNVLEELAKLGLDIQRISTRGYRLRPLLYPLDRQKISARVNADAAILDDRIYILDEVDSTNLWLRGQSDTGQIKSGTVCVAEVQTAGRGRGARSWVATPYSDIVFSVAWRFETQLSKLGGLSLGTGVAVARALGDYGIKGIGLKWPNDVVWRGKKLAGMLVDICPEAGDTTLVIVGVGVNVHIGEKEARLIDQPWVDLKSIIGEGVDRNELVARLISHLFEVLRIFGFSGFGPFRREWERLHTLTGRCVRLLDGDLSISGRVLGVDSDGALQVEDEYGKVRVFHCGDISVRPEA